MKILDLLQKSNCLFEPTDTPQAKILGPSLNRPSWEIPDSKILPIQSSNCIGQLFGLCFVTRWARRRKIELEWTWPDPTTPNLGSSSPCHFFGRCLLRSSISKPLIIGLGLSHERNHSGVVWSISSEDYRIHGEGSSLCPLQFYGPSPIIMLDDGSNSHSSNIYCEFWKV